MSTRTDLTNAVVAMDTAGQNLAAAYQAFKTAQHVAISAAANPYAGQPIANGLDIRVDLAQRLAGLGLGDIVGDSSVANAAAVPMGTGADFVSRLTARIQGLV